MTHTILFAFPDEMSEADRAEFFREGTAMALDSGLVESYEHRPGIPLSTEVAPVFVPSAMARIRYADVESLREYLRHPPVAEFVRRWRRRFPYQAVSVNTED
ncbi:hypothetical protein GCM10010468_00570 [Actinocorallia longicatena]|uniref:Stress responsive alpha/beta barrel protein n=1 Tax=Actinocorallia longicatena TaxID=111803 RepID=A0ABP6PVK9_9ACTN